MFVAFVFGELLAAGDGILVVRKRARDVYIDAADQVDEFNKSRKVDAQVIRNLDVKNLADDLLGIIAARARVIILGQRIEIIDFLQPWPGMGMIKSRGMESMATSRVDGL